MGEFNSDEHYVHYCGQESLRRNGVAIMVNKRVQNALLGFHLKNNTQFLMCLVQCYKEQCCIGTWNIRFMNHGKLEGLKQKARVNIDILGISELKGTGLWFRQ